MSSIWFTVARSGRSRCSMSRPTEMNEDVDEAGEAGPAGTFDFDLEPPRNFMTVASRGA